MGDLITSDLDAELKNSWGTDPAVFAALNKEFDFSLDAAASFDNYLVPEFLNEKDNALIVDWKQHILTMWSSIKYIVPLTVFVNPPYGKGYIKKFMQKAIIEKAKGVTTVMLVPATLDAQWLPLNEISEIRIITGGRLSFMHPVSGKKISGNTKGSMFVIFSPNKSPLVTKYIDRDELLARGKCILRKERIKK